jgi:AraC family transcriptional regulator, regulatory protein of adaptative response / methylated-DNA-[protein]-cysteine methyltransferase
MMTQSYMTQALLLEFERARTARDKRYDGTFYVGVKTTGIYCRPICPARTAKACNVHFYPSAASAEADGYRPCLRCRPEAAPFSPAWNGTRSTVERAMKLIEMGALDDEGMDNFATRLGVGARHLNRLFQKHLGASPKQVAQTMRIQKAKQLIDHTELNITEIAMGSGFKSLRRFNAVFLEVYKRPPSALRRTKH